MQLLWSNDDNNLFLFKKVMKKRGAENIMPVGNLHQSLVISITKVLKPVREQQNNLGQEGP